MQPDLSIVIVTWNTRELLRGCLRSLPAAVGDLGAEVIVVDNDSADGTAAMVREEFPGVRLVESGGNLGFARANDLALPLAAAPRLLLLNPDTVCPPGSLARLAACLDSAPRAAACGPALRDGRGRPTASFGDFPALRHHLRGLIDPAGRWLPRRWRDAGLGRIPAPGAPPGPVDYLKGACLLLRREALAEVGPLDGRFFLYFEETDWCRRAAVAGWEIRLCPGCEVVHLEGGAAEQASRFSLAQFQRSYRLYLAKHRGRGWVPLFRAAQLLEYGLKGMLRLLAPGDRARQRALARRHLLVAGLQLKGRLPAPPGWPPPSDAPAGGTPASASRTRR